MRLSQIKPGHGGTIENVASDGPVGQRLMEMGLFEGASVKVMRVAPLGDPLEIEVQGYRLSLRKVEAERVEVKDVVVMAAPALSSTRRSAVDATPAEPGWDEAAPGKSRKKPA